jgi:hypothetical protein
MARLAFSPARWGIWDYTLFKNAYISSGQHANSTTSDRIFRLAGVKLTGLK